MTPGAALVATKTTACHPLGKPGGAKVVALYSLFYGASGTQMGHFWATMLWRCTVYFTVQVGSRWAIFGPQC